MATTAASKSRPIKLGLECSAILGLYSGCISSQCSKDGVTVPRRDQSELGHPALNDGCLQGSRLRDQSCWTRFAKLDGSSLSRSCPGSQSSDGGCKLGLLTADVSSSCSEPETYADARWKSTSQSTRVL